MSESSVTKSQQEKLEQLRKRCDSQKSILRSVASMVGFSETEKPDGSQLIARLQERLAAAPVAPAPATTGTISYSPGAPSYSPNVVATPPPTWRASKEDLQRRAAQEAAAAQAKRDTVVDFNLYNERFKAVRQYNASSKMTKTFPSHVDLVAGTHFVGDRNLSLRVLGYLPGNPVFAVAACPSWMLEDATYVFKCGDLHMYKVDFVLQRVGGEDARRKLELQRVSEYSVRYGVFPQATSRSGIKMTLDGVVHTVRVVDIRPTQRAQPIVVEDIVTSDRWLVGSGLLERSRPAGVPVVLKRKREEDEKD